MKNFIKYILSGSIGLAISQHTLAQCTVSATPGNITISCGESVDLTAVGLSATPALSTDFNGNQIGAGWSTTATMLYNNPCGPTLDGTPSAWFGNVPLPRTIATNGFDLSCGGQVCFDLDFAGDDPGGGSNCEDPDQPDEGVYFSYSIDGGATWVEIFYFEPTSNITGPYYDWANYCFTLPPAAWTSNTMFQWDQPNISSSVNDHWGLDNVVITPTNCGYWYDWDNVPGSNNPPQQTVTPQTTTTYNVTYTDGVDACNTSLTVTVEPLVADATASATNLVCPNCADLNVELVNNNAGSITDNFDPAFDPNMWFNISSGTVNLNCGAMSGTAMHFDGTGTDRSLTTIPFNATSCGNINFCLFMGNSGSGGAPCENADANENVALEYSIDNGATWINIVTYDHSLWDANNAWQCFSEPIPGPAQINNTMIRWRQLQFSSCSGCDNWSIDDIDISCAPPAYDYSWSPNNGLSDPTAQAPQACPLVNTTYTATITDPATGCSASDDVAINVTCSCQFDIFTANLSNCQNGNEFTVSGGFSYVENPGSGTIEIEVTNASGTYTETVNGPFVDGSNNSYSISGIISDGSPVSVTIYFSDDISCNSTINDVSPALPEVTNIAGGATYCDGDIVNDITVDVTGNGPFTVDYTLNGVPASAIGAGLSISLGNAEGVYVVTNINDQGCTNIATGTETITIQPLPTIIDLSGGDSYCENDPINDIMIDVSGTGPWTIDYTLGGVPNSVTSATSPISLGNGVGQYIVTQVSDANCFDAFNATDEISIDLAPPVNAGADFISCDGDQVVLLGSGAVSYVWDNGVTNGVAFIPTATTTYTVLGTDANGCAASDDITVTVEPLPNVSFVGDVLQGCAPLIVNFTNTTPGNIASCEWNFGNNDLSNDCGTVSTTYQNDGYFDVTLTTTSVNGCVNSATYDDYIYVENDPLAGFNPSLQTLLSLDTDVSFNNTTIGAVNYIWNFGDGSAISNLENPVHTFPQDQTSNYLVTLYAYSPIGCADSISSVIKVTEEVIYYIPNTFTPDNDEFNQHFQPVFTAGYDPYDFNMLIFNRWGEIIFESNDASVGWDGTYGGDKVPDGTYAWKIEFKTLASDERVMISGHVNIIR